MSRHPAPLTADGRLHAIRTNDMLYSTELEHTAEIVARCADILRHLAEAQDEETRENIDGVADLMDAAAGRLADIVKEPARQ